MSASPESLHVIAHRAGARPRDASDWWGSAIETALAAVAATRHSGAHRELAEAAVDRLVRWQRAGESRPVSADAVALALAARAAATLARRDPQLQAAAVAAVEIMAQRTSDVVPELHIALAAWALDELVSDRDAHPWLALRDRVTRGSAFGVDAALRAYTAGTAAKQFDAAGLVQALITQTPLGPGANDATIVLWLLGVGIDRCARVMGVEEPGLRALIERRASITERLALELDEHVFSAPAVGGFDPDASVDDPRTTYLSPMEALLLDIAVAPAEPDDAWLTYPQAEQLFGERARDARRQTRSERRQTAVAHTLSAALAGGVTALALVLGGAETLVAICWALAVALVGTALAVRRVRPVAVHRVRADAGGAACVTGALCAALNAANQMLHTPLLSDAAGLIAGTVVTTASGVLWVAMTTAADDEGLLDSRGDR